MQRLCRNAWCHQPFEITESDLAFYEKVSPVLNGKKELIPPPTLCPTCREQRRLVFRNEHFLYPNSSALSGTELISYLSPEKPYKVYAQQEWWNDAWDPMTYGKEVDMQHPFFGQFNGLLYAVPRMNLLLWQSENCGYCNYVDFCKDCYLTFGGSNCERVYYSNLTDSVTDSVDLSGCKECELCYDSIDCTKCYRAVGAIQCKGSTELLCCYDCTNCQECIGCFNLKNKKYCIFNTHYPRDEYFAKKKEFEVSSDKHYAAVRDRFLQIIREKAVHRGSNILQCEECSGDNLTNSRHAEISFESNNLEDCKWTSFSMHSRDSYDIFGSSNKGVELAYEGMCIEGKNILGGFYIAGYDHVFYSDFVVSCSNVFGCAGLKHKQYCILNKQYTEEEYERLVPKIIERMRADGEWGEFFPIEMSPFAYNETVAQEYFPLTKEEVLERGWKWRDQKDEMPKVDRIIPASQLPDSIDDIPDDILNWAIECETTKRPFKVIRQELDFYRKMRLSVPHFHPDERHRRRMALRNPRKLWNRECAKCHKPIATSYSPERPETVYCEECYLKEVY
ncbi:MAG: hypothetical protein V1926_04210 [Candidatus Peregrinibacteria bacterium]